MKSCLLFVLCTIFLSSKAQFFGYRSIGMQHGIILYSEPILKNTSNANNKISYVNELDKNFKMGKWVSFNGGIGFGNYQNPSNKFEKYQSSNFFRLKPALMFHLPQNISIYKVNPNLINPFFKIGYNFDIMDNTFRAIGYKRLNTSLKLGIGTVIRVNHYVGIYFESSLNQKVNIDYRTFFQHSLGVCINLDQKLIKY